jgi:pilus assembly protein CpaB
MALLVGAALTLLAAGTLHVASSPWGPPVSVLVATGDLEVGHRLDEGDVRRADWPADLVPPGAVLEATGTVVAPVPAGSVVTGLHLGDGGLGTAVPDGRAAVPLPAELAGDLHPGARLDLVGTDLDARGLVLARDAVVLAHDGTHGGVGVDRMAEAASPAAAMSGAVATVLVPP